MNVTEEMFEIRSCIETLANDIKLYTVYHYVFYVNKELQRIHLEPLMCSVLVLPQHTKSVLSIRVPGCQKLQMTA